MLKQQLTIANNNCRVSVLVVRLQRGSSKLLPQGEVGAWVGVLGGGVRVEVRWEKPSSDRSDILTTRHRRIDSRASRLCILT